MTRLQEVVQQVLPHHLQEDVFWGIEQEPDFLVLSKSRREEINSFDLRTKYCNKIKDMAFVLSQQILREDFFNDYELPF